MQNEVRLLLLQKIDLLMKKLGAFDKNKNALINCALHACFNNIDL